MCSQQAARVLRQRWEELAEIFDCVGDDAIATIHTKQFWAKTKRGGVFSSYNASESSCGTRAWRVYQNQLSEKSKLADLQARCRKLGLKEYGSKLQVACEGGEF